jgi:hypothetical protein
MSVVRLNVILSSVTKPTTDNPINIPPVFYTMEEHTCTKYKFGYKEGSTKKEKVINCLSQGRACIIKHYRPVIYGNWTDYRFRSKLVSFLLLVKISLALTNTLAYYEIRTLRNNNVIYKCRHQGILTEGEGSVRLTSSY